MGCYFYFKWGFHRGDVLDVQEHGSIEKHYFKTYFFLNGHCFPWFWRENTYHLWIQLKTHIFTNGSVYLLYIFLWIPYLFEFKMRLFLPLHLTWGKKHLILDSNTRWWVTGKPGTCICRYWLQAGSRGQVGGGAVVEGKGQSTWHSCCLPSIHYHLLLATAFL